MSTDQEKPRPRRRALKVFLTLIVILAVLVYLLPFIASTGPVRTAVLKSVNEAAAPMTLDLASLKLSWTKGVSLSGIQFTDPQSSMIIRGDQVVIERSLLSLAKAGMNVSGKTDDLDLLFAQVTGQYQVKNLHLSMMTPRGSEFAVLSDLQLEMGRSSVSEPLDIDLSVKSGGGGSMTADLAAKSVMQINGDVVFNAFDLEPFNRFVGTNAAVPYWTGQLNGDVNAVLGSSGNISGKGALSLADLVLRGGALGKDKPAFSSIDLSFDLQQDGTTYELKALNIDSPIVKASVGSVVLFDPAETLVVPMSVKGSVKADLVTLAQMFPATLQIREGLSMKSGEVYLSGDYHFKDQTHHLSSDMRVKDLAAVISNQLVRLEQPITTTIDGSMGGGRVQFTTLDLTSSFASIKGQGSLEDLKADIRADLAALLSEARKFSNLEGIDAGGTLSGEIRAQSLAPDRFHLTAGLTAGQLVVKGVTPRPILQKSVQINAAVDMLVNEDHAAVGFEKASLSVVADELRLTSSAAALAFGEGDTLLDRLQLQDASLATTCSLAELLDRVYSMLEATDNRTIVAGRLSLTTKASVSKGTLGIPDLKMTFGPLAMTQKSKTTVLTRNDSTLTAVLSADKNTARLTELMLASDLTSIGAVGAVTLSDKTMPLKVNGRMQNNMPAISRLLRELTKQDLDMTGSATNNFTFAMPLAANSEAKPVSLIQADVRLDVETVRYKGMRAGSLSLPVSMDKGVVNTHLKGRLEGGLIDVAPSVDLNPDIAMLTIPDNSQVLTNVNLTTEMLNRNFDKILPMLNGCVVSTGKISALLQSFSMPLDPEHIDAMSFTGKLRMENVVLQPGGSLLGLLQKLSVDIKPVHVAPQDVEFFTRDKRIYNSPLIFSTGGSYISMKGSVGFDNSFDYLIEIPITPKHVKNDKVYKYLEGKSIPLRIQGQIGEDLDYTAIAKVFFAEIAKFAAKAGIEAAKDSGLESLREKAEEQGVDPAVIDAGEELIKGLEGLFRKK